MIYICRDCGVHYTLCGCEVRDICEDCLEKLEEEEEWEQEYDCIRKMREWILLNKLASKDDLDTIEEDARKYVRDCRDNHSRSHWNENRILKG